MKGQFYQALTTLGLVGKERKAIIYVNYYCCLIRAFLVAQMAKNLPATQET